MLYVANPQVARYLDYSAWTQGGLTQCIIQNYQPEAVLSQRSQNEGSTEEEEPKTNSWPLPVQGTA